MYKITPEKLEEIRTYLAAQRKDKKDSVMWGAAALVACIFFAFVLNYPILAVVLLGVSAVCLHEGFTTVVPEDPPLDSLNNNPPQS